MIPLFISCNRMVVPTMQLGPRPGACRRRGYQRTQKARRSKLLPGGLPDVRNAVPGGSAQPPFIDTENTESPQRILRNHTYQYTSDYIIIDWRNCSDRSDIHWQFYKFHLVCRSRRNRSVTYTHRTRYRLGDYIHSLRRKRRFDDVR